MRTSLFCHCRAHVAPRRYDVQIAVTPPAIRASNSRQLVHANHRPNLRYASREFSINRLFQIARIYADYSDRNLSTR